MMVLSVATAAARRILLRELPWRLRSVPAAASASVAPVSATPASAARVVVAVAAAAAAAAATPAVVLEPTSNWTSLLGSIVRRLDKVEEVLGVNAASGGEKEGEEEEEGSTAETIINWSATHEITTKCLHQPESLQELQQLVEASHAAGRRLRVVGSTLSPNGIGFSEGDMVTLSQCDRVISIDTAQQQVTVEAGARVSQVVDALRAHRLTLPNYASIAEQQIGGFISVGAHGTGAQLPTVDAQVVRMTLMTPVC